MATIDYTKRLKNIQERKFDTELNESVLSKSFSDTGLPENIKYLAESMRKIDQKYNNCLLYTSPSPRDRTRSRMPSSA